VQLREIEEQTLTIFLTSPESIVVTDWKAECLLPTTRPSTSLVCGICKGASRFSFLDYIDPISRDDMESLIQNLINGEDIRNREYQALRADGSSFTALISASLIKNAQQVPVRIILITRDLTEIKSLELQSSKPKNGISRYFGGGMPTILIIL
jgi:PAS domain-containing protein